MASRKAPPVDDTALTVRECLHCGTVERALTVWPAAVHTECLCACHVRRREHDAEADRHRRRREARGIL